MVKYHPTVMIIEDEELLLEAITRKLGLNKISTVSCTSGEQALEYLKNLPTLPDAIWLDYYLHDMNGLEFMQKIKENDKWSQIPVIVVSNSASQEKVHNMLALGAKKYLLKADYKLDEIVDTIKEFIYTEKKSESA